MTDAKAARLSGYYGEMKKFIENSHNNKVIKVANKILAEEVGEVKAWQCKAVALINMEQFAEALNIITKSKFLSELAFEKAYCEYRLNNVSGALDSIQAADELTPRVLELKAQILYRLERYEECHAVYRDMIRTNSDDFDMERETNMTAVEVNLTTEGQEVEVPEGGDSSSYELTYNGGCRLLAAGLLVEALGRLQEAEEQCRTYLTHEEGASEEEICEEVAIIRVQQGHCLQRLGREREALAIYNSVLKTKPDDAALLAIINNNLVSINRAANVFDSRKRMKAATAPGLEHKLTTRQRATIALNHCLLAYHTNQDEVCRSEVQSLKKAYPGLSLEATVVEAALLGREGKLDQAQDLLKSCAKKHPDKAIQIQLMATQILLAKGEQRAACGVLSGLPEQQRMRQGVVSALVALHVALGDPAAASTVLRQAVLWHQNSKTSASQLGELWRHAADFHLRTGDAPTAAASLLELHRLNPSDTTTLAQLITAYARYDLAAAQELSRELPDVSSIVAGLDGEALESALGQRYFKKQQQGRGEASPASPKAPMTPGSDQRKPPADKKKKKRKPRLPKDYNPAVTPDPERWLPRWQRKGYRKKKDRRVKEVMKGTQGVSSEAADKFDITKTAGTHKPAQAAVSPQPEPQGPRRNMKKKGGTKKKKGSGW